MTRTVVRPALISCPPLGDLIRAMRALHPLVNPYEHVDVLKTIGDLTSGGSKTTVSKVIKEMGARGFTLSKWQIRSRIKDLEKESYITMKYPPGKPRLFFIHRVREFIRTWKVLWELFRELISYLKKHKKISELVSADMKDFREMATSMSFIEFIRTYNSIVIKIRRFDVNCGLYIIEIKGLAKRITVTPDGWDVYNCEV